VLVLESIDVAITILSDCEHRFDEHEHDGFGTVAHSRTLIGRDVI
jgi:hypothetical protein